MLKFKKFKKIAIKKMNKLIKMLIALMRVFNNLKKLAKMKINPNKRYRKTQSEFQKTFLVGIFFN